MTDLDAPRIEVITIACDYDTGSIEMDLGGVEVFAAYGLLLAATDEIKLRLPPVRFSHDPPDDEDEDDE